MYYSVAMIGWEPMLIIGMVILVLFGPKKIPELMRGVGQGVGELKKGLEEGKAQIMNSVHEDPPQPPAAAAPVTPAPISQGEVTPEPEHAGAGAPSTPSK